MESPKGEERSHASGARDLTRGTGKAVPRGPGLDSYPGSHVTDYPQSRQYRGISIGVLPADIEQVQNEKKPFTLG